MRWNGDPLLGSGTSTFFPRSGLSVVSRCRHTPAPAVSIRCSHIWAHSSGSWDRPLPSGSWELTTPEDIDGAQVENMHSEESAAALAARIKIYLRTCADLNGQSRAAESVHDNGGQRCSQSNRGAQPNGTGSTPDRHNRPQAGSSIGEGYRGHRRRAVGCASGCIAGQARNNAIPSHEVEVEEGSGPCRDRVCDGVGEVAEGRVMTCSGIGHKKGGGGGGALFLDDRMAPPSPLPPHPIPLRPTLRRERRTEVPRRQTMHDLDSFVPAEVGAYGNGSDCDRARLYAAREQRRSLHRCRSDQIEEVTPGGGGDSARVDHFYCSSNDVGARDLGDSGRSRHDGGITPRGVAGDRLQRQSRDGLEHGTHTDAGVTRKWYFPLNGEVEPVAEMWPAPVEGIVSEERGRQANVLRKRDQTSSVQPSGTDECSAIGGGSAALVGSYNATQRPRLSSSSKTLCQATRCSISSLSEAQSTSLGGVRITDAEKVAPSCAYREVSPGCGQPRATYGKEEACIARAAAAPDNWRAHSAARALNGSHAATKQFDCMACRGEQDVHGDVADGKEDAPTRAGANQSSQARAESLADSQLGAQGGDICHQGTHSAGSKTVDAFAAERQPTAKEDLPAIEHTSNHVWDRKAFATLDDTKLGEGNGRGAGKRVLEGFPSTPNACGQQRLTSVVSAHCLREEADVFCRRVEDTGQRQDTCRAAAFNVVGHWLSRMICRWRSGARHSGTLGMADSNDELRAIQQQETTGKSSTVESTTIVLRKASCQDEKGEASLLTGEQGATGGQGATGEDNPGDESPLAPRRSSGQYNRIVLALSPRGSWARPCGGAVKQDPPDGPWYAAQRCNAPSICHRLSDDDAIGRLSWLQGVNVAGATIGNVSASAAAAKPWIVRDGDASVGCSGVLDRKHPVTAARRSSDREIKNINRTVPVVLARTKHLPHRQNRNGRRASEAAGGNPATEPPAYQASHAPPRAADIMTQEEQDYLAPSSSVSSSLPGASWAPPALKEQKKVKFGEGRDSAVDGGLNHDLGGPCAVDADWFRDDCGVGIDSTTCRREDEGVVTGWCSSQQEREPETIAPMALARGRSAENCRIVVDSANTTCILEGEGAQTVRHLTRKSAYPPTTAQQPQRTGIVSSAAHPPAPSEGVALALLAGGSSRVRREGVDVRFNPLLEARYVRNPLFGASAGFSSNERAGASRALHR